MNIDVPQHQAESLDYSTLSWVKDEISISLDQAQQALEIYAEDPEEISQLRYCVTYLHQIFGTLQMVEIFGAALLAEEMEKTAAALYKNKTLKVDDALDVLMRSTIQLPAYLDNLQQGHPDIPAVLTPLINDLRSARGDTLLTDNAFFNPDLSANPPAPDLSAVKNQSDIQSYARKLRPVFQAALLSWLRDKDGKASLNKLAAVLHQLQSASSSDDARRIWWIMSGIIEALSDNGITAGGSLNILLGQMDAEIKRLIHHGESIFIDEPPKELLKNCLYHIGRSASHGQLVNEIKNAFKLEHLIPHGATVDQAIDALKGSNAEILHNVTEILKNDLVEVIEHLNTFGRKSQGSIYDLNPKLAVLKRSADTLEMLGRQDLRNIIREQADSLQRAINTGQTLNENSLMEIASALVYVDSALSHIEQAPDNDSDAEPEASEHALTLTTDKISETVLIPRSELIQINYQVYKESLQLLAYIKSALSNLELEPNAIESIRDVPDKLLQLKSTLVFMDLERPARLLASITNFIEKHLLDVSSSPTLEQLDTLADAITSIEFYFEALLDARNRPEAVLTVAEISVEQLGYPVSEQTAVSTLPIEHDQVQASAHEDVIATETNHADAIQAQIEAQVSNALKNISVDKEILDVFIDEAMGLNTRIKASFSAWRIDHTDRESLDELRRAYHTLKGSGRLAGALVLSDFAWSVENMLNGVSTGKLFASAAVFDLLDQAQPLLDTLIEVLRGESASNPPIKAFCDHAKNLTAAGGNTSGTQSFVITTDNEQAIVPDSDLSNVFRQETQGHLTTIRSFLENTEQQDSAPLSEELRHALNTLDGSARMAKIASISELSHAMDHLVRSYHNNQLPLDNQTLLTLANFADTIETLADQFDKPLANTIDYSDLLDDISLLQEQVDSPETEVESISIPTEAITDITLPTEQQSQAPIETSINVDYDSDMLPVFLEEAEEIQEKTERIIHDWSQDFYRIEPVSKLQRALHTLKGSARMANVIPIGDLAHAMESLLEGIIVKRFPPKAEYPHLMQACHDWLSRALEKAQQFNPVEPASELLSQIEDAISLAKDEKSKSGFREFTVIETPPKPVVKGNVVRKEEHHSNDLNEIIEFIETFSFDAQQESITPAQPTNNNEDQIRVRAETLNELVNYSGEINIYNSRIGQQLKEWQFNLTELQQTVDRLRDQLRQFEIEAETQIIFRHEPIEGEQEDFDPLELDRFSNMQQLSRGMVESLSDLTSIQNMLDYISNNASDMLSHQQRTTTELQEGLMRSRMVSFSSILPRLRRVVRQTCNETGKFAELKVTGTEADLDRTQLNRIVTIIEHILRNAVDHGIETPNKRDQLVKQRVGQLQLDYKHQGSEIVLKISDDGSGINIDTLRNKAIMRGLMSPDDELSDQEIINFIYEAGFSTAQTLTQISGRGVGLDVVNNEVKQLGGVLHIESTPGKGASFTLNFPLTMLINQALLVLVGDTTYAIPLPHVEHVVRISKEELTDLFTGQETAFSYAGNHYQYLNLGQILHGQACPLPDTDQRLSLLLLRSGDQRIAMHVDQLLERQEIVIKSIGPQLSTVGILSGASILPDGQVALILDIANLIRSAQTQQDQQTADSKLSVTDKHEVDPQSLTIMIVDDSITVRKVTARLLTRYHYTAITAKDGIDALELIEENIPDIMLIDVEMPRMDGYELATAIRNNPRFKSIPIIMITSRSGEKHRQRAFDIGVDMYMGKPFQEKDLIDNIQQLTSNDEN